MTIRTHIRPRLTAMLLAAIMPGAIWAPASAHPGEDHGTAAPAASTPTTQANTLTTSATTEQFELVMKYPEPHIGEPTRLQLFLSDYATNRPIEGATWTLSFKPGGVSVQSQPKQLSPGIYEMTATFPADTVYSIVATIVAADRTDFVEMKNIYAGEAAERFLAEHAPTTAQESTDSGLSWWVVAIVGMAAIGLVAFLIARRGRRPGSPSHPTNATRDPELASMSASEHSRDDEPTHR